MLNGVEEESTRDPGERVVKRMKDERRQALKELRKPIDPRDPRLLANCRIDSEPPIQGTSLDTGLGHYNPNYEAS